jgi:hypothetical protein
LGVATIIPTQISYWAVFGGNGFGYGDRFNVVVTSYFIVILLFSMAIQNQKAILE